MTPRTATSLLRWAARVFGADATRRVLTPLVADWQHEITDARSAPSRLSAWGRGLAAFLVASALVVRNAPPSTTRVIRQIAAPIAGLVLVRLFEGRNEPPLRFALETLALLGGLAPVVAILALRSEPRFARAWPLGVVLVLASTGVQAALALVSLLAEQWRPALGSHPESLPAAGLLILWTAATAIMGMGAMSLLRRGPRRRLDAGTMAIYVSPLLVSILLTPTLLLMFGLQPWLLGAVTGTNVVGAALSLAMAERWRRTQRMRRPHLRLGRSAR